ncbi:hypothetical protein Q5P01_004689 [Channa striata]|uniref:Uncharacterized protein n=1 Tax=Channa striata TaxID=64152 RepID=A0AA88SYQ4_CHASR|nr:hypothetical protein Q5P01_004689 [Channa striata]
MEAAHAALHLYMPISERGCGPPGRGPSSPSKPSLTLQRRLTYCCEEEGPAETLKRGQADRFGFTGLKETLKALDDSSEIHWLTEVLLLCLECQAFMNMGNQQGTKPHSSTESGGVSPKPPRIQIPRKRRRRAEGMVYAGNRQHNLKVTPKTPQVPAKARRTTKHQIKSSPMCEEWDLEENGAIIGTPTARRKRAEKREERIASLFEERNRGLQRQCGGEQLPDADLSEYDNDIYSTNISHAAVDPVIRSGGEEEKHKENNAEGEEMGSCRWSFEETEEKRAAAQRVMGKIEEVERIIRRVSLSSSEWNKESSEGGGEGQCISDGCADGEDQVQILQPGRTDAGFSTHSRLDNQDWESSKDTPRLVEELWTLAEALSLSLHQAPSTEGVKAEREANTPGPSQLSGPLNLTDQHESGGSESHTGGTVQGWWVSRGPGTSGSDTTVSSGTENEQTQTSRRSSEASQDDLLSSDEALQRQEEIWQQEVEESLSFCRSLSHPSRPKHVDFLRITAPVDDVTDTPTSTPPPPEVRLTGLSRRCHKQWLNTPSASNYTVTTRRTTSKVPPVNGCSRYRRAGGKRRQNLEAKAGTWI